MMIRRTIPDGTKRRANGFVRHLGRCKAFSFGTPRDRVGCGKGSATEQEIGSLRVTRTFQFLAATATAALLAGAASAATVEIVSVTGAWTSLTGGQDVLGIDTSSVRWGEDIGNGQSGYDFTGIAPSGPHNANTLFDMGIFTHVNRPVEGGTSITAAVLEVLFTFTIDGGPAISRSSVFDFNHWETTNDNNPCADGGVNGVGINVNGCADNVDPQTNPDFTETFEIAGVKYVFDVTGFDIGNSFWTKENALNTATIRGRFTEERNISPIPLPAAGWLLLAGVAGLGVAARKRRAA